MQSAKEAIKKQESKHYEDPALLCDDIKVVLELDKWKCLQGIQICFKKNWKIIQMCTFKSLWKQFQFLRKCTVHRSQVLVFCFCCFQPALTIPISSFWSLLCVLWFSACVQNWLLCLKDSCYNENLKYWWFVAAPSFRGQVPDDIMLGHEICFTSSSFPGTVFRTR